MRRSRTSTRAAILLSLLWASSAWGEPTSESIRMAKKRFAEGVAAADAGNYEAARVAFQQAYALKPHPSVLHNLGQSELKTGRYLEAARHLATFLRDTTFGTPTERDTAKKALAQAEAKLSRLVVEVDVDGAEISVDAEPAGRSPMGPDPAYVEPGERVVHVQKEGYQPFEQRQSFEPGRTAQLKVSLRAGDALPTPAASISRSSGSLSVAPTTETASNASEGVGPPPAGLTATPDSGGNARTIVLVTTGGLGVVSLGVWIGFALKGQSLASDEENLRGVLAQNQMAVPSNVVCASGGRLCDELQDIANRRASANQIAVIAGVATGVSAAAFAATWFLWPKQSRGGVAIPTLTPALTPNHAGLALTGVF